MLSAPERLETDRLVLRRFTDQDREPFAAINADPDVLRHIGPPLTREQSDALVDRIRQTWVDLGFGLYAAESRTSGELLGFIGLNRHRMRPDDVEIGWRLGRASWGQGLATEGASAVRDMAFAEIGLSELISITVAENVRSIRVMEKLGFEFWMEQPFETVTARIYRLAAPER